MLEISGKVQWSSLFLHHKTAIFIFTHKAYNDGLLSILASKYVKGLITAFPKSGSSSVTK